MIIQNAINFGQAAAPEIRAGDATPKVAVKAAPPAAAEPSPQQLRQAVDGINRVLQTSNSNLEFSVDAGTRRLVVKVVDRETGDVIRQIPSKEILAIAASIGEFQKGLLLRQEA